MANNVMRLSRRTITLTEQLVLLSPNSKTLEGPGLVSGPFSFSAMTKLVVFVVFRAFVGFVHDIALGAQRFCGLQRSNECPACLA